MTDFIYKNNILENINTILIDKDSTFIEADAYWGKVAEMRVKKIIEKYNLDNSLFCELCEKMGYDTKNKKLIINGAIGVLSRNGVIDSTIKSLNQINIKTTFDEISEIFGYVHDNFLDDIKDYTHTIQSALDFIKTIKSKNIKLAIVTSDTHKNTDEILKHLNIKELFDEIIGKDDCKSEKKTGEPAKLALKLLNAKPETTIAIGDAPMDYYLAKNGGLRGSILVATGLVPKEELLKLTNFTVNNLSEVTVK